MLVITARAVPTLLHKIWPRLDTTYQLQVRAAKLPVLSAHTILSTLKLRVQHVQQATTALQLR